jgi:site-specific recombinase XerD
MSEPTLTIGQLLDIFLANCQTEVSARHRVMRQETCQLFAKQFGQLTPKELKAFHMLEFVRSHPKWKSNWTIQRNISVLQCALNWLVLMDYMDKNPFKRLSWHRGKRGQAMSEDHFVKLVRHTTAPFRRMLYFVAWVGCRPCEASNLEWRHLDWERGLAVLPEHKTEHVDGKPRILYFSERVLRLLAWLKQNPPVAGRDSQRYVFVNSRGRKWTRYAIALKVQRLRKKGAIPKGVKVYGLRHRYATNALRSGLGVAVVAELLGHKKLETTQIYLHLEDHPEELRRAADNVFAKEPTPLAGPQVVRPGKADTPRNGNGSKPAKAPASTPAPAPPPQPPAAIRRAAPPMAGA